MSNHNPRDFGYSPVPQTPDTNTGPDSQLLTSTESFGHAPRAVFTVKSRSQIEDVLRAKRITPTRQRVDIARMLLAEPVHLSAEEVYERVTADGARVSRATVYNTLSLLVEQSLINQVIVDPSRLFYDSNTTPHHHFYDVDSGTLTDIPLNHIEVKSLPAFPDGKVLAGVDVIVRLRDSRS